MHDEDALARMTDVRDIAALVAMATVTASGGSGHRGPVRRELGETTAESGSRREFLSRGSSSQASLRVINHRSIGRLPHPTLRPRFPFRLMFRPRRGIHRALSVNKALLARVE